MTPQKSSIECHKAVKTSAKDDVTEFVTGTASGSDGEGIDISALLVKSSHFIATFTSVREMQHLAIALQQTEPTCRLLAG